MAGHGRPCWRPTSRLGCAVVAIKTGPLRVIWRIRLAVSGIGDPCGRCRTALTLLRANGRAETRICVGQHSHRAVPPVAIVKLLVQLPWRAGILVV